MADREGRRVDCVGAGIRSPQFRGSRTAQLPGLGRVFGLAGRGTALLAVTGAGSFLDPPPRVRSLAMADKTFWMRQFLWLAVQFVTRV